MTTAIVYQTKAIKTFFGMRFAVVDTPDQVVTVMTIDVHGSPDGRIFDNNHGEIDTDSIMIAAHRIAKKAVGQPAGRVIVTACFQAACKAKNVHPMIVFPGDWEGETGVMEAKDGSGKITVASIDYFVSKGWVRQ